jgi:hypothetical protein
MANEKIQSSQLFNYAVIWNPTEKQAKDGEKAKLVVPATTLLAKDSATASILVAKQIPDEYNEQLDQLSIVISPF